MNNNLFRKKPIDEILNSSNQEKNHLSKSLNVVDLTALGIAAVIGAGIFSTIGNASASGGPAVSLLFIFTAIACSFSALCYAEFASRLPLSGSAYTYAYASLGELVAWIIGWDLLMEYSVGNIAVAISWSDYFTSFLSGFGIDFPSFLSMDYLTASRGYHEAINLVASGTNLNELSLNLKEAYHTWTSAPQLFGFHIIADIPAFSIVVLITILVYIGIKETKTASNIMVLLKLVVIVLILIVGSFYVKPENWSPFAPNGVSGVLKGVSAVFFAYIGFDAISTTAEECKNPQRDLPRAMMFALIISTALYVLITLVLTGMAKYSDLAVGDPLAFVFRGLNMDWLSGIISLSAIIAMASVLLVFQVGQPRIWMSMSRDGLLPKRFSRIHPRFHTPSFSTVITGFVVAIPSLFLNLTEVTDLTSIGTLFAFIIVCGGVLVLKKDENTSFPKFKIYYINSKYIIPALFIVILVLSYYLNKEGVLNFFDFSTKNIAWDVIKHKIPMFFFIIIAAVFMVLSYLKSLSLIPVLGLLTNLYLMTELGITNWLRFFIWLAVGLIIYFTYSIRHSKLRKNLTALQ